MSTENLAQGKVDDVGCGVVHAYALPPDLVVLCGNLLTNRADTAPHSSDVEHIASVFLHILNAHLETVHEQPTGVEKLSARLSEEVSLVEDYAKLTAVRVPGPAPEKLFVVV